MAGDWIKIEKATAQKPEVLLLSEILGIHYLHAFGLCFKFWSWCDDQLATCHAQSVTFVTLDSVIGHAGFATALVKVGWLRVREGSLEVPNFDRHLSESAKNRALCGKRKRNQRTKNVTEMSRSERDKSVTREEKRREDISSNEDITPLPPKGGTGTTKPSPESVLIPLTLDTPEFRTAWSEWLTYRRSKRKPVSAQAAAKQLAALVRAGPALAVTAIEKSIANDWQGIFTENASNQPADIYAGVRKFMENASD